MAKIRPLSARKLCQECKPSQFKFKTTDDLEDLTDVIGQDRAVEAIQFGIGIQREGYNLFALGPSGTGKRTTICQFLDLKSAAEPTPSIGSPSITIPFFKICLSTLSAIFTLLSPNVLDIRNTILNQH